MEKIKIVSENKEFEKKLNKYVEELLSSIPPKEERGVFEPGIFQKRDFEELGKVDSSLFEIMGWPAVELEISGKINQLRGKYRGAGDTNEKNKIRKEIETIIRGEEALMRIVKEMLKMEHPTNKQIARILRLEEHTVQKEYETMKSFAGNTPLDSLWNIKEEKDPVEKEGKIRALRSWVASKIQNKEGTEAGKSSFSAEKSD